jgi:hypothetical protein
MSTSRTYGGAAILQSLVLEVIVTHEP